MKKNLKILFTGGKGFIGREIIPLFRKDGYEVVDPSSKELNLLDSDAVKKFIEIEKKKYPIEIVNKPLKQTNFKNN